MAGIAERRRTLVDGSRRGAGHQTLVGYLPSRTFELVVHTLDLASATGAAVPAQLAGSVSECVQVAALLAAGRDDAADLLLALTGRRALPVGFKVV